MKSLQNERNINYCLAQKKGKNEEKDSLRLNTVLELSGVNSIKPETQILCNLRPGSRIEVGYHLGIENGDDLLVETVKYVRNLGKFQVRSQKKWE